MPAPRSLFGRFGGPGLLVLLVDGHWFTGTVHRLSRSQGRGARVTASCRLSVQREGRAGSDSSERASSTAAERLGLSAPVERLARASPARAQAPSELWSCYLGAAPTQPMPELPPRGVPSTDAMRCDASCSPALRLFWHLSLDCSEFYELH